MNEVGASASGNHLLHHATGVVIPLTEKEMLEELRTFVEHLEIDCKFITHHTIAANLSGPGFLKRKPQILSTLNNVIQHGDMDALETIRTNKRTL